jgi:HEAT repeat protein
MEIWNYIEILKSKKQGWFFQKDNVEEKLIALEKIAELGTPTTIHNLIPFLKDNSSEIQNKTCQVIILLFNKINTKKDFYDTLKHCSITKSDLDFYDQNFKKEEKLTLFSISSLNGNGYVREKALKMLSETENPKAIPFIVYRLADWVPNVRNIAIKALDNYKKEQYINNLVDNLSIFDWLQKVERIDLSSIYSNIMSFVLVENKNFVRKNFTKFTDKTRLIIAKQISNSNNLEITDLKLFIADKHFLVRSFVIQHFDKLNQSEINNLLNDKSARIRIQTLYQLNKRNDFSEIIYPFLFDNSATIREFARYSLKGKNLNYADLYNEKLLAKTNIIGSLSGIGETNGKEFIETIEGFLNNDKIKIKKTAFLALKKLDVEKAHVFALKNLDCEQTGIRNVVIDFLSTSVTPELLEKSRKIYENSEIELKKSMLKLFSKIGKWTTIADIMIGTIDENEEIRELSLGYLRQWKVKAISLFTNPKQGELERANQIFRFANEMHEEKKFFKHNPLEGIDFYLK